MKDHRFTELLNLYIDRQISATETAELEAEIQQNSARQAVYRQYCQIHSATKLVYASFRVDDVEPPLLPSDRAGVVELFETKRRRSNFAFSVSAFAAAACLALIFLRPNSVPDIGDFTSTTQATMRPSAVVPPVVAVAAANPALQTDAEVGLVSLRYSPASTSDYAAMLAALREQDEEQTLANGQAPKLRVQSLFDDGLFNPNRQAAPQDPGMFRLQPASNQQLESTAFQFQR